MPAQRWLRVVEQPELEHARGVEAVDPESRARSSGGRTGRHEPDKLRAKDRSVSRRCLRLDALNDLVQCGRLPVFDIHRHLDDAGPRQVETERSHAGKPAALLPDHRGDLLGGRKGSLQIDVERDQRATRAEDHAACARVKRRRAEARLELVVVEASLQLGHSAAPVERRPPVGWRIDEHRQPELGSDAGTDQPRRGIGPVEILRHDRDQRHDVGGADSRMGALVRAQIDPLDCDGDSSEERIRELVLGADEGEHRPVVIRVGMHVKEARVPTECGADLLDGRRVAAFAEVGHRLEGQHAPYSRAQMDAYYDARAPEYDDWYRGVGLFAERDRPGWDAELDQLHAAINGLPPMRTLDVACGTGFLTRHLPGTVVGLDQSAQMLEEARRQAPDASFVQGDGLALPFPDASFARIFSGHFYGHLREPERAVFLAEARRVAAELVVVDASRAHSEVDDEMQERILNDGTRWEVYKRWFTGSGLAAELGGGEVLHDGRWFVAVSLRR